MERKAGFRKIRAILEIEELKSKSDYNSRTFIPNNPYKKKKNKKTCYYMSNHIWMTENLAGINFGI